MADKKATLTLPDGKTLDFPVMGGTIGPDVVDIRTLYGKSGLFTYDPGFLSTASGCRPRPGRSSPTSPGIRAFFHRAGSGWLSCP